MTIDTCLEYADLLEGLEINMQEDKIFFSDDGKSSTVIGYLAIGELQAMIIIKYGSRGGVSSNIILRDSSISPLGDSVKYGSAVWTPKLQFDAKSSLDLRGDVDRRARCEAFIKQFFVRLELDKELIRYLFENGRFEDNCPSLKFVGGGAPGLKK